MYESPYTERFTKKYTISKCENLQDKTKSLDMMIQHLSESKIKNRILTAKFYSIPIKLTED